MIPIFTEVINEATPISTVGFVNIFYMETIKKDKTRTVDYKISGTVYNSKDEAMKSKTVNVPEGYTYYMTIQFPLKK